MRANCWPLCRAVYCCRLELVQPVSGHDKLCALFWCVFSAGKRARSPLLPVSESGYCTHFFSVFASHTTHAFSLLVHHEANHRRVPIAISAVPILSTPILFYPILYEKSRQNAFSHTSFGSPAEARSSRWLGGRSSPATTTMGLFGLGAPEIAVCIAVAALILGPDKMAGGCRQCSTVCVVVLSSSHCCSLPW